MMGRWKVLSAVMMIMMWNGCDTASDTRGGVGPSDAGTTIEGIMGSDAGSAGTTCGPSETACDSACVDLNSDVAHCGACGNSCVARANTTASCTNGTCDLTCLSGYSDCNGDSVDGCEVNLQSDANNCGSCGNTCPGGLCRAGSCEAPDCSREASFTDCARCFESLNPAGSAAYRNALANDLYCGSSCGTTSCLGFCGAYATDPNSAEPDMTCARCVQGIDNSHPDVDAFIRSCMADTSCDAFARSLQMCPR